MRFPENVLGSRVHEGVLSTSLYIIEVSYRNFKMSFFAESCSEIQKRTVVKTVNRQEEIGAIKVIERRARGEAECRE